MRLGRAQYRHGCAVPLEEHVLIMAPPRTYKTAPAGQRSCCTSPGPVVSTTTKHDVFQLTSGIRSRLGPVHVFNPQRVGGVPSTFRWNPVAGCADPATAIRRADGFAHAVNMSGTEDASFWTAKASDYLRCLFHAAALAGGDMRLVARWALGSAEPAEDILDQAGRRPVGRRARRAARRGAEDRRDDQDGAVPGAGVHGRPGAGPLRPARRRVGRGGHRGVPRRVRDACT